MLKIYLLILILLPLLFIGAFIVGMTLGLIKIVKDYWRNSRSKSILNKISTFSTSDAHFSGSSGDSIAFDESTSTFCFIKRKRTFIYDANKIKAISLLIDGDVVFKKSSTKPLKRRTIKLDIRDIDRENKHLFQTLLQEQVKHNDVALLQKEIKRIDIRVLINDELSYLRGERKFMVNFQDIEVDKYSSTFETNYESALTWFKLLLDCIVEETDL